MNSTILIISFVTIRQITFIGKQAGSIWIPYQPSSCTSSQLFRLVRAKLKLQIFIQEQFVSLMVFSNSLPWIVTSCIGLRSV